MWPVWAIMAAAGAVKGAVEGEANKKNQRRQDAFRKAAIQYSPWSGMSDPGAVNAGPQGLQSITGGAIQGGVLGALGQGAGLWGGAAETAGAGTEVLSSGAINPNFVGPYSSLATPAGASTGAAAAGGGAAGAAAAEGAAGAAAEGASLAIPALVGGGALAATQLDKEKIAELSNPLKPSMGSAGAMGLKKKVIPAPNTWEMMQFGAPPVGTGSVLRGGY